MPLLLPVARCALTAPFHPYRSQVTGGIFSAALSVGSRLPGVTWHPAQWSPDFPPSYLAIKQRLLSRLFQCSVYHTSTSKRYVSRLFHKQKPDQKTPRIALTEKLSAFAAYSIFNADLQIAEADHSHIIRLRHNDLYRRTSA